MTAPSNNVLIVAHKFLTQPDDDLILFLNRKKYGNVAHITHSFSDAPDRISKCVWYRDGELYKSWRSRDYRNCPEIFVYVKELTFTVISIFRSKIRWDMSVCMDGLCTFYAMIGRLFKRIGKVVYWAVDFVPESRFNSKIKNFVYHSINILGYKKADEMWDLSPRMLEAREKFLGIKLEDYKKHKVVPYGVWVDRIKKYSYEECEKNTLVFMGHLLEKQGVQLVLRAIPEVIKKVPDFKFKIIGGGSYWGELAKLVKELKVEKYCDFKGKIENDVELEDGIAKSCVAIAPYIKSLDTWTYYADPGKVKKYLGCGVPVLLTNVPWNASNIEKARCGLIINEDNFVKDIILLMSKDVNIEFRQNCIKFAKSFDYNVIFSNLET